ncbi:MAG TPA: hypothetical protein PLI68_03385 [Bacteroidia bacterium]|nr:hypothetical protein [Bacteroidia bacterium]HRH07578.1 hypothetical protein [Bacteroidia bacterium]HRH62347.1 hypothetical protein [Bacteroidia bacterium]
MKQIYFFLILLIGISGLGYSQNLVIEANYFDENSTLYMTQFKYSNKADSSTLFLHLKYGKYYLLKRSEWFENKIRVVKEDYFFVRQFENILRSTDVDSIKILFYGDGYKIRESIIRNVSTQNGNSKNHLEAKNIEENFFVAGNSDIYLDSVELKESVKSYYNLDTLKKVEIFNSHHMCQTKDLSYNRKGIMIIAKHLEEATNSFQIFKIDIVNLNTDTTEILWQIRYLDRDYGSHLFKHLIRGNYIQSDCDGKVYEETEYANKRDIFKNLLLDWTLYEEPVFRIALYEFDRIKFLKKSKESASFLLNEFKYDDKLQVVEEYQYCEQNLTAHFTNNYK